MGNFDTMKLGEDFFEGREDSDPDELLRKLHLLVSRGGAAGTLADMQARRAGFERRYGRVAVTEDAVRKMAAFYLRWEAGLPTVVIGEAGCGKTMLVRFFAELMGFAFEAVTMDGGTTREQVVDLLLRAARHAKERPFVLFLDECNACDLGGVLEQVLTSRLIPLPSGRFLPLDDSLKLHIVAACNPYRRLPTAILNRLKGAGMGYLWSEACTERLGVRGVAMRELVYRVRPLPPSLLARVFDYGALGDEEERKYVAAIIRAEALDAHTAHDLTSRAGAAAAAGPARPAAAAGHARGRRGGGGRRICAARARVRREDRLFVELRGQLLRRHARHAHRARPARPARGCAFAGVRRNVLVVN